MFPLESPVMVSPFSANATHNTYFGFSCFYTERERLHFLAGVRNTVDVSLSLYFWTSAQSSCSHSCTSNRPCLLVRVVPSTVQKLMCDFPQVTIKLASMGWNTAASTESLEHCKQMKACISFLNQPLSLQESARTKLYECIQGELVRTRGLRHLDISQLFLLLPVPDWQDVIVGIVHSAEEGAAVLRETQGHFLKACVLL